MSFTILTSAVSPTIVFGGELDPGVLVGILIAERYLFLLLVEADDVDIDLVADIEYFGRILDAAPTHLGDVNHTVDTADINERTVAGHGLDDTVILIADLHLVPDGLCLLAALFLSDGTDGTDNALAAALTSVILTRTFCLSSWFMSASLGRRTGMRERIRERP